MAPTSSYQRRLAIRQQIEQLLITLTALVSMPNPSPAAVDAAVAAINAQASTYPLLPKPTYSAAGRSTDWTGYLNALAALLRVLDDAVQRAAPLLPDHENDPMKGQLFIDFDITPTGRTVRIGGQMLTARGHAVDVTNDAIFCLGVLEYAKQIIWDKEKAQLQPVGNIEIPQGVNGEALRAK